MKLFAAQTVTQNNTLKKVRVPMTAVAEYKCLERQPHSHCQILHSYNTQFTQYNRLSNWFYIQFDNRPYRVNKHPTGSQTGFTTGWMFVYMIQPVVSDTVLN